MLQRSKIKPKDKNVTLEKNQSTNILDENVIYRNVVYLNT